MKITTAAITAALLGAIAFGTTACTTDATPTDDTTTTTVTTTPAPTTPAPTTPAPEVEITAGAEITADTELPAGVKGYELPDGTIVAVEAKKPLPKAVAKDVKAKAKKALKAPASGSLASLEAAHKGASDFAAKVTSETGKYVAVVFQTVGSVNCGNGLATTLWTSSVGSAKCMVFTDKADAIAIAEGYVAKAIGGPDSWIIVEKP